MHRWIRLFAAVAALTTIAACGEGRDPRAVAELTPALTPVVQANNQFAWNLYSAASHAEGNLFFSPFSVSAAFGMTLAGADGDTATQMQTVLGIQGDPAAYHQPFGALVRDLGGEHAGRGYELYVADRLFGQKGTQFAAPFLALVKDDYGAPLDTVDYGAPSAAVDHINEWVSASTKGKIPNLLSDDLVDSSTRLVLANAIYFKASWATEFDPSATAKAPFERIDGSSVDVDMMATKDEIDVRTAGDEDVSVLDLDYEDAELSMTILMPTDPKGFHALEARLTPSYVDGLLSHESKAKRVVRLPRWELGLELPLRELLVGMGMTNAFDPDAADFSKMVDPAAKDLYLRFAIHKAFVKVDEEGTEAAAATAGGTQALSLPPEIVVDHAFVYLIRDRLTGSVLFMGRMDDPTDRGTL